MPSKTPLTRLPPELRRQIFLDVVATDPGSKSLLAALRPTIRDSNLYMEAIEAYYDVKNCTISWTNTSSIQNLSPETKKLIRFLQLNFSVMGTTSTPVRFAKVFQYTANRRGRMLSYQNIYEPISHKRFLPRPTFETIAAFESIRTLHLNAAAVEESRFHQIEGMVKKALQMCVRLERVEVQSDTASARWWRDGHGDARAKMDLERTANQWWVARLNEGMGIEAKLVVVDSLGLSWHWFWQAADRETLVWTEKQEPVRSGRRIVLGGI